MSTHSEIAQKSIEAFNARDWDRMASYNTPNCVYDEVGTGRHVRGNPEVRKIMEGWTKAFTDAKGTVNDTLEKGDTVVVEVTWKGTQKGPLEGPSGTIPPSGRSMTTRAVQVIRFDNDKIAETRHYFDMVNMLKQLGALPAEKARKAGA